MRLEKHREILNEVLEEIEAALHDPRGVTSHQRRLALTLSLGFCEIIEIYFHKLEILKSGSRLKHDWFRQKRIKEILEQQVIAPLDSVKNIDPILQLATAIEQGRDDLAYGSPGDQEKLITEKIHQFLQLKKLIEQETGETYETK